MEKDDRSGVRKGGFGGRCFVAVEDKNNILIDTINKIKRR
jgi:hypothetical protein